EPRPLCETRRSPKQHATGSVGHVHHGLNRGERVVGKDDQDSEGPTPALAHKDRGRSPWPPVYRSRGDLWQRISHSLIAANGSVSGASYLFLDKAARRGVSYRYRIRAVNRDGTTAWFGPVRVM